MKSQLTVESRIDRADNALGQGCVFTVLQSAESLSRLRSVPRKKKGKKKGGGSSRTKEIDKTGLDS